METISNKASVVFSYEGSDATYSKTSNTVNSSVKDKYSLKLEKTATKSCFKAGDTITYMIHATNDGCCSLCKFSVVDTFDNSDYISYVDGSARLFVGGSMKTVTPGNTSPLSFEFSDRLERDEEFILQYNMLVSADISLDINEIKNSVKIEATSCDCAETPTTIEAEAELIIPKCEYADVLISKSVSHDSMCCGDEIDYIITLTNVGTIDATNVVVTDSLPEEFTLTEVHSENNGVHYKYDASEYDLDDTNLLTLPNATGTAIVVPAIAAGSDNITKIRLHGHM